MSLIRGRRIAEATGRRGMVMPAHKQILSAFSQAWNRDLPTQETGKVLTSLSIQLGVVIAELTERGVDWETIDRNIRKSVLRGADRREEEKHE